MNKKTIIIIIAVVALLAGGLIFYMTNNNNESEVEEVTTSETETPPIEPEESVPALVYEAKGVLEDVSSSGSSGQAEASYYDDGTFNLAAEFQNLAPTSNGDFYEGWLVNQTTSEFFSTGMVQTNDNQGTFNEYMSSVDHLSAGYDFYVLTLEPDDGDPAPAAHVVEGLLEITTQ